MIFYGEDKEAGKMVQQEIAELGYFDHALLAEVWRRR